MKEYAFLQAYSFFYNPSGAFLLFVTKSISMLIIFKGVQNNFKMTFEKYDFKTRLMKYPRMTSTLSYLHVDY
jgi:hypothetical protein